MATVYVKTAEGGETTTPTTSHYLPLDDGINSTYVSAANLLKIINVLAEDTAPDSANDLLATYDASAAGGKKVKLATLVNGMTEDTNPDEAADFLLSYDTSAAVLKKVKPSNITLTAGAGTPVQSVHTQTGTFTSLGTTQIPLDDTIPASTEGNAVTALNTTITPTSATNKLLIEVVFIGAHSAGNVYVCLFQDAGAAALKVAPVVSTADALVVISFQYEMTAGTTSATTFKLRAGSNAVGTMYFNGRAGAQVFGGVLASSMRITEIKV